jgi:hypothetical protein
LLKLRIFCCPFRHLSSGLSLSNIIAQPETHFKIIQYLFRILLLYQLNIFNQILPVRR